jgi:hypothetical protein
MRGARSTKLTVDNTQFDSMQEAAMYCWCKEAQELGVIESFLIHTSWIMTPKATYEVEKQLKTKVKTVEKTLLQRSTYTCDFIINPYEPIPGLIYCHLNWGSYVIDVKGAVNRDASAFSLKQKVMWHNNRTYVNKVVVAYDNKKHSASTCAKGFFAINGRPKLLPAEFYYKDGSGKLKQPWQRMFGELPLISEVYSG